MTDIAELFDVFFNRRAPATKVCAWTKVVHASGRVSTMFATTDCGHEVATPTDARFCHMCGRRIFRAL